MSASTHATRWSRPVRALMVAVILVAGCTASTLSPNPSPLFSPVVDPNPSPLFSPVVDPNPSPPFSPVVDPNPSPPFSPVVDPNPSPLFSPVVDPDPSPPPGTTWTSAGRTLAPRYGGSMAAVGLADGRVLVVEGAPDPESPGPSAEIWTPSTSTWKATPGLTRTRSEFALVALDAGRALVVGGLNAGGYGAGQSYSSACVFDLARDRAGCAKVGLMHAARSAPGAVLLADGRVLVVGGYFNTGETTGRVATPGELTMATAAYRMQPGAAGSPLVLADVEMPDHGYALATAELFDPRSGTWEETGPMRYARVRPAMALLSDGRVLVVGSDAGADVGRVHPDAFGTAEIYDVRTGRFGPAMRLPAIDREAVAALGVKLPDGEGDPGPIGALAALPGGGAVLVGYDRWWKHMADVVRSFRYDPAADAWRQVGATCAGAEAGDRWVATPGDCHSNESLAALADGRVLAVGGDEWTGGSWRETPGAARILDPTALEWTVLPPMPIGRTGGRVVALPDGSAMVLGGLGADGEPALTAVRYTP